MQTVVLILTLLLIAALAGLLLALRRLRLLRRRLVSAVLSRSEISNFLNRFSKGINREDGVDGMMCSVARSIAEEVGAESVAVYAFREGMLFPEGVCGDYPLLKTRYADCSRLLEVMRQEGGSGPGSGFLWNVFDSRHPELVRHADEDPRFASYPARKKLKCLMAAPMIRDGEPVGVICVSGNRIPDGELFSETQFHRLISLSNQVAIASRVIHGYEEISRRERIDQELDFVRHYQMALLPPGNMELGNFSICAKTTSAKEVNGDFFDMVRIDDDRMLILVGDACGKGMPACMMAAMTRSFARCLCYNFTTLTDFLRYLNINLNRDTDADRFITLGCCLIDRRGGLVEIGRAGHTDIIMHVHGHLRRLSPRGTALGMLPDEDAEFDTICLSLDSGTGILLYSDGLSEAVNHEREEFGVERLSNAFSVASEHHANAEEIVTEVMNAVHDFQCEQNDDQTVMLIRYQ